MKTTGKVYFSHNIMESGVQLVVVLSLTFYSIDPKPFLAVKAVEGRHHRDRRQAPKPPHPHTIALVFMLGLPQKWSFGLHTDDGVLAACTILRPQMASSIQH
jgi:hypothetical protein